MTPFTRCESCGAYGVAWRCRNCGTVRQPGFDDSPTPPPDASSPLLGMLIGAAIVVGIVAVGVAVAWLCRGGAA